MGVPGDRRAAKDNPRTGYGASDNGAAKSLAANIMALVAFVLLFDDDEEDGGVKG
jgi:hypothetical protein